MSNPKHELLTPANCTLILIDHQPQMTFGVANIDRQLLKNNVLGLAKAASVFQVPTVLTAVETESFSGYLWPEIVDIFPGHKVFERSSMNTWDDAAVKDELKRMIQAGAVPITWQQFLLEMQRDWSRKETYDATLGVVHDHSGAYGVGVEYAKTMVHKMPQSAKSPHVVAK